jgi:uncharacterized membrane protein (DUF373 family)
LFDGHLPQAAAPFARCTVADGPNFDVNARGGSVAPIVAIHTSVHRLTRRFLEPAQDVLIVGLGLALFGVMVRTLTLLVTGIVAPELDFRTIIAEVLFMLLMVELLRLLLVYLQEHRVAVDFMVELGIVATLREVVLRGVIELDWVQIVALSVFILALGALLRFGDLRAPDAPRPHAAAARQQRRPEPAPGPAGPTPGRLGHRISRRRRSEPRASATCCQPGRTVTS